MNEDIPMAKSTSYEAYSSPGKPLQVGMVLGNWREPPEYAERTRKKWPDGEPIYVVPLTGELEGELFVSEKVKRDGAGNSYNDIFKCVDGDVYMGRRYLD